MISAIKQTHTAYCNHLLLFLFICCQALNAQISAGVKQRGLRLLDKTPCRYSVGDWL